MKKLIVAVVVLAAFGSAAIIDGVGGLGFDGNAARIAVLKDQKRFDASVIVKQDKSVIHSGENKEKYKVKDFSNSPYVSWTDKIGKGFYKVGLGVDYWVDEAKTHREEINNTVVDLEYAYDFGFVIGGIGIASFDNSTKHTRAQFNPAGLDRRWNETSNYVRYNLGLAKVIDSKQTILLGYNSGPGYTITKKQKGSKAEKTTVVQDTSVGLGYVYALNNALQLGAQAIGTWSHYFDPTKTFGVAVSYLPLKALELQAYANFTDGIGGINDDERGFTSGAIAGETYDVSGENQTNYGANIEYTIGKLGTIGGGVDVTKWRNNDTEEMGKNVTGRVTYKYLF